MDSFVIEDRELKKLEFHEILSIVLSNELTVENRKIIFTRLLTYVAAYIVVQEAVKRYINEQQGKDVFEYNVFGSPNQKIGNFTGQQKLERWSA